LCWHIDTWPQTIIILLFLENTISVNIYQASAVFYGHGVPFRNASQFYKWCNEHGGLLVTLTMGIFYSIWVSEIDTLHLAQWYNTKHKKFLWINELNHPQLEPVSPHEPNIPLG